MIGGNQRHDSGDQRGDHRPHAADGGQRRAAPAIFGQERDVELRQDKERHDQVDHNKRQRRKPDRRRLLAAATMLDLGRIKLARRRGAFAHDLVRGRLFDGDGRAVAKALARALPAGLCAGEPPHPKTQHDNRRNDA